MEVNFSPQSFLLPHKEVFANRYHLYQDHFFFPLLCVLETVSWKMMVVMKCIHELIGVKWPRLTLIRSVNRSREAPGGV